MASPGRERGRLTRQVGRPSSTRNPIERGAFSDGAVSWRMESVTSPAQAFASFNTHSPATGDRS
jgi:hypothetical protein